MQKSFLMRSDVPCRDVSSHERHHPLVTVDQAQKEERLHEGIDE